MKKQQTFIIDFDSTFISVEALDALATIALADNPKKEKILAKIKALTARGMEGKLDFPTSLQKRLLLFKPHKTHIKKLVTLLKGQITQSVLRNKGFFQQDEKNIYIISGGFIEYIFPIVKEFGIKKDHILANRFVFNKQGVVSGFDKKSFLAQKDGKVKAVASLKLSGEVYVIGDGYTDYQIKEQGFTKKFFLFTENVSRPGTKIHFDEKLSNFDELLYKFHFPRALSYPKSKIKVLLLENINLQAVEAFEKEGYQVETHKSALVEDELLEKIHDVSILGIRSKTEITQAVFQASKKLLAIGAFCIGTNQIDLKAANDKGVAVFNAPYSNTRSVVEMVLGEIIVLYRKLFDKSVKMHQGTWDKSASGLHELRGKTLGIIGYGNIGTQLAIVAENMGMHVLFYDKDDKLALSNSQKCESLEELLKASHVITIHVDGAKENTNFIGKKEFDLMKDNVLFINASRGFVVDIQALVDAIVSGKVGGAAVDVFPQEPKSNADPFVSPLQGLPNVILTPHIGGSTEEAQKNIGEFVSHKLIHFVNTGSTLLSVNFPELQLPDHINTYRFMHIHKNIPGMLASVNSVLANEGVNIVGQYLKTNDQIGYVILDINTKQSETLVHALTAIPGTIKVRVLY